MIKKLHHIGIAVSNLEEGIALYERLLGVKHLFIKDLPAKQARVAMIQLGDDVEIELLSAAGPECDIKEFIEQHGEGIHHIALVVDDIEADLKNMEKNSIKIVDRVPRQGVAGKVAFLDTASTRGVMMELVQPTH
jgi:methylmalonyl-CoA epimerase